MSYHELNDIVSLIVDENPLWEGDLIDLNDKCKDLITFTWLNTHQTWLDDVFPHTCSDRYELALSMTYGSTSRMLAAMFRDAEQDHEDECDNDAYFSEALNDFSRILDSDTFIEQVRDNIYLYLEDTLRDRVEQSFSHLIHQEKTARGVH